VVQAADRPAATPRRVYQRPRADRRDHQLVQAGNTDPTPFIWHAKAEDIITKVRRGRATLTQVKSKTVHQ
jgi:hypothetical protein